MKRILTHLKQGLSLALCAVLLAGCAAQSASSAVQPALPADPLTGLEMLWPGSRPAAITIENGPQNTTQWGISTASVVLEARTEIQGSTRLCLVYPSVEAMPRVGPVASGEDLYWRLLAGQQVLPIQRGGGRFDQNYLDYYSVRAIDALETGRNAFSCGETWSNTPLWYTSGSALTRAAAQLGISTVLTESRVTTALPDPQDENATLLTVPALLPQAAQEKLPEPTASDAQRAEVHFDDRNITGFVYDAASQSYQMLHADGTPQLDANTGSQAAFDNLLVLFSASTLRDDDQTFDYDLTMGGGVWLHKGQMWYVTWAQGSETSLLFYGADGQQLTLEPGRSYLAFVSSVTGHELRVTTSTGENLIL